MTSYIITCNSYMMSFTAHLQGNNLLSFITQCLTQSLQFSWSLSFCTICSYKSTDYSFTITCMSQHCKMSNIICTANIYIDMKKVDM